MRRTRTIGNMYLSVILMLCLAAAALAGCSGRTGETENTPGEETVQEPETVQTTAEAASAGSTAQAAEEESFPRVMRCVYRIDTSDGYDEYQILYYTPVTNYLLALTDELHLYKSGGYTMDALTQADVDKAYPGFSTFSFTDSELLEDEEKVYWILRFHDLDDPDNLRSLHENGILTVQDPDSGAPISAESYRAILEENGAEEIGEEEYAALGLHMEE